MAGVKVVQKGDRLLLPLASSVVLGPKDCVMIVPLFKLSGIGIQNVSRVCQIREILTVVSARNGGGRPFVSRGNK